MVEPVRVVVDGEAFDVLRDGSSIHFTWVSGPNTSYGFSLGGASAFTDEDVRSAIRGFLAEVDPKTGYLAE